MNKEVIVKHKILVLMKEYIDKEIDKNFIESIVNLYVELYDLKKYLTNIIYINNSSRAIEYIPFYKSLYINIGNLIKDVEDSLKSLEQEIKISNEEYIVAKQLFYIITVIHELKHIEQTAIIKSKSRNIEHQLLRIESMYLHNPSRHIIPKSYKEEEEIAKGITNILDEYHDSLLSERLANIESLEFIQIIADRFPNLKIFFKNCLKNSFNSGYIVEKNGIITSPTYTVIKQTHQLFGINIYDYPCISSDLGKTVNKVKRLSLEKRVRLGLPVSPKEFSDFLLTK